MADIAKIGIDITANADNLQKGFSAAEIRVKQLEQSIARLNSVISNTSSQKQLSSALDALKNRMSEFNKINSLTQDKFKTLPSTINQATFTLNNFNRVVQDAPFGIRGIANNIDPLVESFIRLRQQTGSTRGALGGLVTALTGPAGILFAVSSVTSFLVAFGDQIFNPIGESARKQKKDLEEFKELLASITGTTEQRGSVFAAGATTDITKVQALVNVVKASTTSDKQKAAALEQLKNINESYFGDITLTSEGLKLLTQRQNEFVAAIQNKQVIQGFGEEINKVSPKIAELDNQIADLNKIVKSWEETVDRLKKKYPGGVTIGGVPSTVTNAKAQIEVLKQLKAQAEAAEAASRGGLVNAVVGSTTMRSLEKPKKELGDINDEAKKTIALAEKLSNALGATISVRLNIGILDTFNEKLKKATDYLNAIRTGDYKLIGIGFGGLSEPTALEIPVEFKEKKETQGELKARLAKEQKERARAILDTRLFEALYPEEAPKIPLDLSLDPENLKRIKDDLKKVTKDLSEDLQILSAVFSSLLTPAFDSFFQAFEENKNAGQAFFQGLTQGIKNLVQEMIKLAAISAAISLFSGGKISFGTAFKTLSGFGQGLPGRANGGPVSGGNPYLVGERGPELFLPQVSGTIIPNYSAGSFMGGMMGNSGGRSSVLRGQDILLAYARTQRSQLRVNG